MSAYLNDNEYYWQDFDNQQMVQNPVGKRFITTLKTL